jgi:peptide/nickel transport system ATP-binding protein
VLPGETLGLVGESGCGKSTTGRALIQLPRPNAGRVRFEGAELTALRGRKLRSVRPRMQMIFQDPISSLNPRRKVEDIVAEGIDIGRSAGRRTRSIPTRDERIDTVLTLVGLDPASARERRPHEFSGGQCQRISIARALVTDPKLVICDEPVSALDVSVQAQILNLLADMKARYGLTLVFIAHDLAVVKNVSDRVAVMYLGKLCEVGPPEALYERPSHPYTAALLAAIPEPDPAQRTGTDAGAVADALRGEIPSPTTPPSGCRFRTRCPRAQAICAEQEPVLEHAPASPDDPAPRADQYVACHFPL